MNSRGRLHLEKSLSRSRLNRRGEISLSRNPAMGFSNDAVFKRFRIPVSSRQPNRTGRVVKNEMDFELRFRKERDRALFSNALPVQFETRDSDEWFLLKNAFSGKTGGNGVNHSRGISGAKQRGGGAAVEG
jgi:hypothetical protein